jgi:hypothetical protein
MANSGPCMRAVAGAPRKFRPRPSRKLTIFLTLRQTSYPVRKGISAMKRSWSFRLDRSRLLKNVACPEVLRGLLQAPRMAKR